METSLKNKLLSLFILGGISTGAVAARWEKIKVPGALCGDGSQYHFFFREGDPKRVSVELMGGGACWDKESCWGPDVDTYIHYLPRLKSYSYLTGRRSPVRSFTQVYFPYCTGDVWMGAHVANYEGKQTYHFGRRNLELSLAYLRESNRVKFSRLQNFLLYGSSAGAIGALIHTATFEGLLNPKTKRLMLADSPGLHWGKNFWKKFTPKLLWDFAFAFTPVGLEFNSNDGLVAPQLKNYCARQSDWKMGFIQSTRDKAMSLRFGNISQDHHRELVLGPNGIRNTLRNSPNCQTEVVEGQGHMLMILPRVLNRVWDEETGISGREFVDDLIEDSFQDGPGAL